MKKLFTLAILGLGVLAAAHAQRLRAEQGELLYRISYPSLDAATIRKYADVLPDVMQVFFRYNMYCSEVRTVGSYSKTILDARNGDITIMAHVVNRKILVHKNGYKKEDARAKYYIEKTDSTRTIAGYTCHKANVTILNIDNTTEQTEIWYCEDLGSGEFAYEINYPDIRGIIMEYTIKQEGIRMVYTVEKVNTAPVNRFVFDTTVTGYEEMTERQFMHLMTK